MQMVPHPGDERHEKLYYLVIIKELPHLTWSDIPANSFFFFLPTILVISSIPGDFSPFLTAIGTFCRLRSHLPVKKHYFSADN